MVLVALGLIGTLENDFGMLVIARDCLFHYFHPDQASPHLSSKACLIFRVDKSNVLLRWNVA